MIVFRATTKNSPLDLDKVELDPAVRESFPLQDQFRAHLNSFDEQELDRKLEAHRKKFSCEENEIIRLRDFAKNGPRTCPLYCLDRDFFGRCCSARFPYFVAKLLTQPSENGHLSPLRGIQICDTIHGLHNHRKDTCWMWDCFVPYYGFSPKYTSHQHQTPSLLADFLRVDSSGSSRETSRSRSPYFDLQTNKASLTKGVSRESFQFYLDGQLLDRTDQLQAMVEAYEAHDKGVVKKLKPKAEDSRPRTSRRSAPRLGPKNNFDKRVPASVKEISEAIEQPIPQSERRRKFLLALAAMGILLLVMAIMLAPWSNKSQLQDSNSFAHSPQERIESNVPPFVSQDLYEVSVVPLPDTSGLKEEEYAEKEQRSIAVKFAASEGNPDAIAALSLYYQRGDWVEPNIERAFRFAKKAADAGSPTGHYLLAKYYQLEGHQNPLRSSEEMKLALDHECPLALWEKISDHFVDLDNLDISPSVAETLQSLATKGLPNAQFSYGIYLASMHEPPEVIKSWISKAYEAGFSQARYAMAFAQTGLVDIKNLSSIGFGGELLADVYDHDPDAAVDNFLAAAELGCKPSLAFLNYVDKESMPELKIRLRQMNSNESQRASLFDQSQSNSAKALNIHKVFRELENNEDYPPFITSQLSDFERFQILGDPNVLRALQEQQINEVLRPASSEPAELFEDTRKWLNNRSKSAKD